MASKTSFDAMFSGWAAQTVAATEAPACLLKRKQRFAAGNDIKGGNQDVEPIISIRQRFRVTLTERDGGTHSRTAAAATNPRHRRHPAATGHVQPRRGPASPG